MRPPGHRIVSLQSADAMTHPIRTCTRCQSDSTGAREEALFSFSRTLPDEPVLLYADPTRLSQVIENIVINAAKNPAGNDREPV